MLTLIKENVEYNLVDGSIAYYLGDSGWGMFPLHRLFEHGPLQNGDTDLGYRAEARFGKLFFQIVGQNRYELYQKRLQLMELFAPSAILKLRWAISNPEGDAAITRQFDVVFAGDMDFPTASKHGYAQKVSIQLKASDPTCYDPDRNLVEFSGGLGDGLTFPMLVPIEFGLSVFDMTQNISNQGNVDEYPEITIVGPITNPVITHLGSGDKIDITGTSIGTGYTWVIDLRYGYKTVIELPSTNRLDKLTTDSDLATFRLYSGYNDIKVTGSGVTSATKIQFRFYDRYTGV